MCNQWWDYKSCGRGRIPLWLLYFGLNHLYHVLLFFLTIQCSPLSFLQFFDMSRHDAMKALNVYKRAGKQVYNVLWIFFLTIWIAVNFFLCSMWMKFILGNIGLLVFLLYRLKILLIFMTVARVWILLGTISFHLWDRFLFCLKKMTSTLYLKACFYKHFFFALNSHLHHSLQQWKNI